MRGQTRINTGVLEDFFVWVFTHLLNINNVLLDKKVILCPVEHHITRTLCRWVIFFSLCYLWKKLRDLILTKTVPILTESVLKTSTFVRNLVWIVPRQSTIRLSGPLLAASIPMSNSIRGALMVLLHQSRRWCASALVAALDGHVVDLCHHPDECLQGRWRVSWTVHLIKHRNFTDGVMLWFAPGRCCTMPMVAQRPTIVIFRRYSTVRNPLHLLVTNPHPCTSYSCTSGVLPWVTCTITPNGIQA